jgi:acyl CoA:acetate/3-ketoacid CoA transferase beta subunit
MVITDLAVFARADHRAGFQLVEMAPGVGLEELRSRTTARFE